MVRGCERRGNQAIDYRDLEAVKYDSYLSRHPEAFLELLALAHLHQEFLDVDRNMYVLRATSIGKCKESCLFTYQFQPLCSCAAQHCSQTPIARKVHNHTYSER